MRWWRGGPSQTNQVPACWHQLLLLLGNMPAFDVSAGPPVQLCSPLIKSRHIVIEWGEGVGGVRTGVGDECVLLVCSMV